MMIILLFEVAPGSEMIKVNRRQEFGPLLTFTVRKVYNSVSIIIHKSFTYLGLSCQSHWIVGFVAINNEH